MQPKKKKSSPNLATERLRQARLRERRKAEGWRRVTLWLTPQEAATLESIGDDDWLGRTVKALLCESIQCDRPQQGQPLVFPEIPPLPPIPDPETFTLALMPERDLMAEPASLPDTEHSSLMAEVDSLLALGLSGGAIARQFNAQGRRTAKGAEYRGANLLRDWRKWKGAV